MRTNKFRDFRPARVRQRAMAMFLGSIVLLIALLLLMWFVISRFVQSHYQAQLKNHVEILSSIINGLVTDVVSKPDEDARSKEFEKIIQTTIERIHYSYEGYASIPLLSSDNGNGYFFAFRQDDKCVGHGLDPDMCRRLADNPDLATRPNRESIKDINKRASESNGRIGCLSYNWDISAGVPESKLGCVKRIDVPGIDPKPPGTDPRSSRYVFFGTAMLQGEISSHAIQLFIEIGTLMAMLYAGMILLSRSYRKDMEAGLQAILDGLAVGILITRKDKVRNRETILVANREVSHLYGVDRIGGSGPKILEQKGLERMIPVDQEKNRRPDSDLTSQRAILDYTSVLQDGGKLLLRDVAVPLWSEDGLEVLHTIIDRKHSDTYEGFLARFKKYLPPFLFEDESRVAQQVRQATVLVCELPGLLKLYDEAGIRADECAKDLNDYVTILLHWSHDKVGVVEKIAGDKFIFRFGTSGSAGEKDDTRLCLEAAIGIKVEIQQLIDRQQKQKRPVVPIRMGIATGQFAASELGTPERADVIMHGEALILAEMLSSNCPAGQILVNERAKDNSSSSFNFVATELPKECTWKEQPLRVFRLTSSTDFGMRSTKPTS